MTTSISTEMIEETEKESICAKSVTARILLLLLFKSQKQRSHVFFLNMWTTVTFALPECEQFHFQ